MTTTVNPHLMRNPSDGVRSTRRTNLQSRRSELNREIHKEIRLRAGVENLIRATSNRSVQQTASLELSFINSHLKLLREQLDDLNGSLDVYQGQNPKTLPMIPLGLKETKDIDFRDAFKDFILEHYSENGDKYEGTISSFMELRQAMRRPSRTSEGIQLLLQYLANLYYVERRFFPVDRNIGIYFEWYDSITGLPSIQKTITFEKASVLFNLAAIYTQIGTKAEADEAIDNYLRGAGILEYIREHFSHPPSFDLSHDLLRLLVELLMVQSHEILFNKQSQEPASPTTLLLNATESSYLSDSFTHLLTTFTSPELNDFIPPAWANLVIIKHHVYKSLANLFLASLLLRHSRRPGDKNHLRRLEEIYVEDESTITTDIRVPKNSEDEATLGYCHVRMGLTKINDAQRVMRLNRLRGVGLEWVVQSTKEKLLDLMGDKSEDELETYLDPPKIGGLTAYSLTISPPDLSCTAGTGPITDPFQALGPLSFFSAKKSWTSPKRVTLSRKPTGFGISVKGSSPVTIVSVDENTHDLHPGDVIISINNKDTKWCTHDDVVELVKMAGQTLVVTVVRPVDQGKNTLGSRSTSPRDYSGGASSSSSGSFGHNSRNDSTFLRISTQSSPTTMEKLTRSLFRSNRSRSRSKSS